MLQCQKFADGNSTSALLKFFTTENNKIAFKLLRKLATAHFESTTLHVFTTSSCARIFEVGLHATSRNSHAVNKTIPTFCKFFPVLTKKKSTLHYTRGITPKRVTTGGVHLRDLALGQHNSEETTQQWRDVGDTVSDLTSPGIEPTTIRTDRDVFNHNVNRRVTINIKNREIVST